MHQPHTINIKLIIHIQQNLYFQVFRCFFFFFHSLLPIGQNMFSEQHDFNVLCINQFYSDRLITLSATAMNLASHSTAVYKQHRKIICNMNYVNGCKTMNVYSVIWTTTMFANLWIVYLSGKKHTLNTLFLLSCSLYIKPVFPKQKIMTISNVFWRRNRCPGT